MLLVFALFRNNVAFTMSPPWRPNSHLQSRRMPKPKSRLEEIGSRGRMCRAMQRRIVQLPYCIGPASKLAADLLTAGCRVSAATFCTNCITSLAAYCSHRFTPSTKYFMPEGCGQSLDTGPTRPSTLPAKVLILDPPKRTEYHRIA